MKVVKFEVNYQAGHSYAESWSKTNAYCPDCGKQSAWHDQGGGDYYVDEEFICTACGFSFHLPCSHLIDNDHAGLQRLAALRAADQASERLP